MTRLLTTCFLFFLALFVSAQDAEKLFADAKAKIDRVNNYVAKGKMKTNVSFLKVPVAEVTVTFRKPDQLKIVSEKGISFVPKGAMNINLVNLSGTNKFTVIDAGTEAASGLRILRLLPVDENAEVVLSTAYIDAKTALIKKVKTTTRENGSYELELTYGKYAAYALPDKLLLSFSTKDYKLPKGVTFDFDDGSSDKSKKMPANKKGQAEIVFRSYDINK